MAENLAKEGVGTIEDLLKAINEPVSIDNISKETLASLIDHTLLKPEATEKEIIELCREADQYKFKSVCINPYWIPAASDSLKDSIVKICTVIGFPLGANSTSTKVHETNDAIDTGADEVDMVINIGALKSNDTKTVEGDIRALAKASENRAILKVIFETCLLNPDEIELASKISMNAGAQYVKTSTGFSTGGATVEAVEIMRKIVGNSLGVKASGGVRDKDSAIAILKAGASRIGASAGIAIVSGEKAQGSDKY